MLTTFLVASALSALTIYVSNRSGFARLSARSNAGYGWVGGYDGNVAGGVLQGVGMAVTGADPGTGIVQGVCGVRGAGLVVVGGVLGGLGWILVGGWLRRSGSGNGIGKGNAGAEVKGHTVMQRLGVGDGVALMGYEVFLLATILAIDRLGPSNVQDRTLLNPVLGGCLIGAAQAMSVLLSGKTLGISSAYSDVAAHIMSLLKGNGLASAGFGNIVFAAGVGLGAKLVSLRAPVLDGAGIGLSVPVALAGGFLTIFGARMAGGCTSGHGISGMSTLSVSSFVTMVGMFGGGIVVQLLLNGM